MVDLKPNRLLVKLTHKKLWLTFNPWEWQASNFSLQYQHWITHKCQENKSNYHQLKKLLIIRQILLVSTLVNVQRTAWRIWILMLGCNGLIGIFLPSPVHPQRKETYCRVWKELLVPKKIVELYQCTGKRHSWERLGRNMELMQK